MKPPPYIPAGDPADRYLELTSLHILGNQGPSIMTILSALADARAMRTKTTVHRRSRRFCAYHFRVSGPHPYR